ncbi:hypothetical protein CP10139811_0987 [Chlamydia ibidis]|uniref:Uncharacterized protein n=2 Tax=Chlamydia ibidis TaxID=1405396 RepID=S7J4V9_9CHLA|nr:hypothetical protein CP10139811_0987 [Chlamydia ibidis]EQM62989.1 hypothetical protein H359_0305 [Chlamydia ibidis 10-1398/6]
MKLPEHGNPPKTNSHYAQRLEIFYMKEIINANALRFPVTLSILTKIVFYAKILQAR